jgi:hypothetical protein
MRGDGPADGDSERSADSLAGPVASARGSGMPGGDSPFSVALGGLAPGMEPDL